MKDPAAKKMKQRSAGQTDIELGSVFACGVSNQKISQAELGDKLGVSFQQGPEVRERRQSCGAARLQSIATALDVPSHSSTTATARRVKVESLLFLDSAFSLRLLRAYSKSRTRPYNVSWCP